MNPDTRKHDTPAIELRGLCKRYGSGDTAVDALKGVDMRIAPAKSSGWRPQRFGQKALC